MGLVPWVYADARRGGIKVASRRKTPHRHRMHRRRCKFEHLFVVSRMCVAAKFKYCSLKGPWDKSMRQCSVHLCS